MSFFNLMVINIIRVVLGGIILKYEVSNWIEVSLSNLENNIKEIRRVIPSKTNIIAVVKSNAYGHSSVLIAKKLMTLGIDFFAVNSIDEGIELRKNNIKGNILILGYTDLLNLENVIKYDLIQTIVDYDYFLKIKKLKLKNKLKCHLKINTGMNRMGVNFNDFKRLDKIYRCRKINVLGIYSHLSVSDSEDEMDILFTKNQIRHFDECVNYLKNRYDVGIVHLQNSYGVVNYSYLKYDYVRIGIIMYGVNSRNDSFMRTQLNLKSVLSLKSRVVSIRKIKKGESIGYGRSYVADKDMRIGVVPIGYFNGIDRRLSNNLTVRVGKYVVKVVGRICMNQLMIDISGTLNIKVGDIVCLIDENLKVENIADMLDSISYEVLSRLNVNAIKTLD